eukprot:735516-Rhodomonas_salina.2
MLCASVSGMAEETEEKKEGRKYLDDALEIRLEAELEDEAREPGEGGVGADGSASDHGLRHVGEV